MNCILICRAKALPYKVKARATLYGSSGEVKGRFHFFFRNKNYNLTSKL